MATSHANFAYSTVLTAPTPADTGTSVVVQSGDGAKFPTAPFQATVWPVSEQPTRLNSEIVTVTAKSTDTFTITRAQEGTFKHQIAVGCQIAATVTAQVLTDMEDPQLTYTPVLLGSGTQIGAQTLGSASSAQAANASAYFFPITVSDHLQFNRIALPMSISYVFSNVASTINITHKFLFGLYSMQSSTAIAMMANTSNSYSNSFSIAETIGNSSVWTASFPTTTATSGYGYSTIRATAVAQVSSQFLGYREFGLQFGSNIYLTPDIYYMGLLYLRTNGGAATSAFGLSIGGVMGHIMNPINMPSSASSVLAPLRIGVASSEWTASASNSTGWWGRHMVAFVTSGAAAALPTPVPIASLANTSGQSSVSIIPTVSFYSI